MNRLAIIGAGDLGVQIKHLAAEVGSHKFVGFFDDQEEGLEILGKIDQVQSQFNSGRFDEIVIAIGYNHLSFKKDLFDRWSNIPFATLIHPDTHIDQTVRVGKGTCIYRGTVIDMNCKIGENVLINIGVVIAHDTRIDSHCFVSPGVTMAGFIHVYPLSVLGIGSVIIDNITIESGVKLGAGTVVTKSLEEPGLYVGVPQRLVNH